MLRVAAILYSIIGASLAGTFIIVTLVARHDSMQEILIAAVVGFVVGLPVSYIIAKKIT